MILTEIGEVGVHAGGVTYTLRPSLYAMACLGEPAEIVEIFARVMGEYPPLLDCMAVIHACSDDDVSHLFGAVHGLVDRLEYRPGKVPQEDVVQIARCLIKHGVSGALPALPRRADQEQEYISEFNARSLAATAIAHLGMTSAQAWHLTMTELVGAMLAKFPPDAKSSPSRAPTLKAHEETMAWFDEIDALRKGGVV